MLIKKSQFILNLSTKAGSCLTPLNWQEVEVSHFAYYLDDLLLKPGLAVLKKLRDLKGYLGISGSLILNAAQLTANSEGIISIKSLYDGSKIKISSIELYELVQHLNPEALILPKQSSIEQLQQWLKLNDKIFVFIQEKNLHDIKIDKPQGICFNLNKATNYDKLPEELSKWSDMCLSILWGRPVGI